MSTSAASTTGSLPSVNSHVLDQMSPQIAREVQRVQRYTIMLNQDGYWITAMRFPSLQQARTMAAQMSQQSGLDVEVRDEAGKVLSSIRH